MTSFQKQIKLKAYRRGYHLITDEILKDVKQELSSIDVGIFHVFIQHTSASLTINENADPDVRVDFFWRGSFFFDKSSVGVLVGVSIGDDGRGAIANPVVVTTSRKPGLFGVVIFFSIKAREIALISKKLITKPPTADTLELSKKHRPRRYDGLFW